MTAPERPASMRPPEFTGGKLDATAPAGSCSTCFNEAAGIHRRKAREPPKWPSQ